VGVPVICPVAERLSPGGKVPAANDQVYGCTPPVADRLAEYITFCVPVGSRVVVMDSGPLGTVTVVLPLDRPMLAIMLAIPPATPVATPELLMVATLGLEELQVT
jgi:hypothetical protein